MKPITKHSPQEQKAAHLWAGFRRENQQDFWVNYEKLLNQSQTVTHQTKLSTTAKTPKATNKRALKSITFHSRWQTYLVYVFVAILCVIQSLIITMACIETGNIVLFLIIAIPSIIPVGYFLSLLTYFKVNTEGIGVYSIGLQKAFYKWSQLKVVRIDANSPKRYELVLGTNEFRFFLYRYKLSHKAHKQLFKILRKRVDTVDDSKFR